LSADGPKMAQCTLEPALRLRLVRRGVHPVRDAAHHEHGGGVL